MTIRVIVRKDTYHDSVILMRISNNVAELDGITQAAVVMATATNKVFLENLNPLN